MSTSDNSQHRQHRKNSGPGGMPVTITYIGNFLSKHGLNPTYAELLVPQLRELGYEVRTASERLTAPLRLADGFCKVLRAPRRNGCVVLDFYGGPRSFLAGCSTAALCRTIRRKYILVLHGGSLPERLTRSRSHLTRAVRGAARVIAPSRYLAERLGEVVKSEVIPNAIRIADYAYRPRPQAKPDCFYLRAIHRNYGAVVAIQAFIDVARSYPNATLRMAGPDMDDCRAECQQLVNRAGLAGRIELLGRISKAQVAEYGTQADIFVNPTFVDNTPVSVVEAMAMGLCVVATNVGGLPYLLKDRETAVLVEPRSESAIALAIREIVSKPELAARLSHKARQAAEQFDWSNVLPKWKYLLHSVATAA